MKNCILFILILFNIVWAKKPIPKQWYEKEFVLIQGPSDPHRFSLNFYIGEPEKGVIYEINGQSIVNTKRRTKWKDTRKKKKLKTIYHEIRYTKLKEVKK